MKFSDMKLVAKNAVRAYFVRSWTREDLMNDGEMTQHAYTSLRRVYFSLFFATGSFTFGSILHLIWQVGGRFTVLDSVASLLGLYFTSPLRVRMRVSLLMFAACNFGASFGLLIEYLFGMNIQILFVSLLLPLTLGIGAIWIQSLFTRRRSGIYLGCLIYTCGLVFSTFCAAISKLIDGHGAYWMVMVCIVFALFMEYIVVYSQEILYDAHFGEINFVNRTLSFLFRLPGIVFHAARLCLTA